uniref:Uncharacterized protein n=1 Tax=Aegilops tauschii TaxID=37682 RepID=M8BTY1_AEGTA
MAGAGVEGMSTVTAEENDVVVAATSTTSARPLPPVEKMKGSSMEAEEGAMIMSAARLDGEEGACGDPSCKVGPHPPVKNMISLERIEYILSWEKPARRDLEEDEDADFFNEMDDSFAEFQQDVWKEVC